MLTDLMRLEVYLRVEDYKLLLKTLPVIAQEMVLLEVVLQRIVVQIIMWLSRISPVAKEAPLVLAPAVLVKFIAVVEALTAKVAKRVSLETGLVHGTRLVVTFAHVLAEFLIREHLMLVCENLFVPGAEVAHLLVMHGADVAMQVWPTEAGEVAVAIGAVISQEEDGIAHNVFTGIPDADVVVGACDLRVLVLLEPLIGVICENDKRRGGLGTFSQSNLPLLLMEKQLILTRQ